MSLKAYLLPLLLGGAHASGQSAIFTPLGDLAGGVYDSSGADVSAGGRATGHSSSDIGFWGEAFVWDAGSGLTGLGVLPGHNQSQAIAISPDGGWVVGRSVKSPEHVEAMGWSGGTGMFGLGDLPGGDFDSLARGVSRNGRVIVGFGSTQTGGVQHGEAFRWTSSTGMVGLGDLPGGDGSSSAYDVSADGRVIVGAASSGLGGEAFRWTVEGGMVGLGAIDPEHFSSAASAVSPNGEWVVGSSRTGVDDGGGGSTALQAVRWGADGEILGLGWLSDAGGVYSFAHDVSDDGMMVVGRAGGGGMGDRAFLWTPDDGMRTLHQVLHDDFGIDVEAMGWRLDTATGISGDGTTIIGTATNPDGRGEAWMIRIVPAPSTLVPLMSMAAVASWRRR